MLYLAEAAQEIRDSQIVYEKAPANAEAFSYGIRQCPTLPGRLQPSTIGAERLNFCVRYGNRWDPFAITTGILSSTSYSENRTSRFLLHLAKNQSSIFPLVSLDSQIFFRSSPRPISISKLLRYRIYTADLSPGSLPGVLLLSNGILILEVGFTLRCLQRLSRPHFASLLCRWHDNSCTSGASTPVLSY